MSTHPGSPPDPSTYRDMKEWARALVSYMTVTNPAGQANLPRPVQLAHRLGSGGNIGAERAVTPGTLMFDPVNNTVDVSDGTAWQPLASMTVVMQAISDAIADVEAQAVTGIRLANPWNFNNPTLNAWSDAPTGGVVTSIYFSGDGRASAFRGHRIQQQINGVWSNITGGAS